MSVEGRPGRAPLLSLNLPVEGHKLIRFATVFLSSSNALWSDPHGTNPPEARRGPRHRRPRFARRARDRGAMWVRRSPGGRLLPAVKGRGVDVRRQGEQDDKHEGRH